MHKNHRESHFQLIIGSNMQHFFNSLHFFQFPIKLIKEMQHFGCDVAVSPCLLSPLCGLTQCPAHNTICLDKCDKYSSSLSAQMIKWI